MVDGENFDVDEDDLMEEDELLYDDDQKEDEIAPSLAPDDSFRRGKAATDLKDASLKVAQPQNHPPSSPSGPGSHQDVLIPKPPLQSPFRRTKGSPSPLAAGLSLRKRNLIMGRASPKPKEAKGGPPTGLKPSNVHVIKAHVYHLFTRLYQLLARDDTKGIHKGVCWIISRITDGKGAQIEDLLETEIYDKAVNVLKMFWDEGEKKQNIAGTLFGSN
ncbi:hypothetical protein Bca101_008432 [Brassica carinata]